MKSIRRSLCGFVCLAIAALLTAVCEAQSPPTRILPLGDSLTRGYSVEGGYRNRLYTLLDAAGYQVDFIGNETDTANPLLPDPDHQGLDGFRIDQIQANLASWLRAVEDPDVVLLLIGTNDFSAGFDIPSAADRLENLVADIATRRPFARIVVASLPPRTDDPSLNALQATYNAAMPGMVARQVALGRRVSFADANAALNAGDLADGVHLTAAGYEKLAATWFAAIGAVITPLGDASAPAVARVGPPTDLQSVTLRFSKPLADSAADPAWFAMDRGVTVTGAVLDATSKRVITLTTSPQSPATLYRVTIAGVRDRTSEGNSIAAGSIANHSSFTLGNGGFEDELAGWTAEGNLEIKSPPPYAPSQGTKLLAFNTGQTTPDGVISRSFPTVAGSVLELTFDAGTFGTAATQELQVTVTGANPLAARTVVVTKSTASGTAWQSERLTFVADGPTATVTFRDQSTVTDSVDLVLDDVLVTVLANPENPAPVALVNGGFEDGETGWQMAGNYLVYPATPPYSAFEGGTVLVMNGGQFEPNAVISQSFVTQPGQSYRLDFQAGIFALAPATQVLGVEVSGANPLLAELVALTDNGQATTVWNGRSFTFTADSASTTLTFRDLSPTSNGVDLLLDAVAVTLDQVAPNTSPVAAADSYQTAVGTPLAVAAPGVLSNDTDAEGNSLVAALQTQPAHGTVTLDPAGGFTYTPDPGFSGGDSFTYRASDGSLDSDPAMVSVLVQPLTPGSLINGSFEDGETGWQMTGNYLVYPTTPPYEAFDGSAMLVMNGGQLPPSAVVSQTFATTPGQTYLLEYQVGILSLNSSLQALGVELTGTGPLLTLAEELTGNGQGNTVWQARSHAFTADSTATTLVFRDLSSTTNSIDLLVDDVRVSQMGGPSNTAPTAAADAYATNMDTLLTVPAAGVLTNDTDAEADPLAAVLVSGPAHGTLALAADGGFTYTPEAGYTGDDSFAYLASDGVLDSDPATVTIRINAPVTGVLANGSFEADLAAWTATGNLTIEPYPGTDGVRLVAFNSRDLKPDAVLSQTFATVPGKTYTLTFDAGVLSYVTRQQKMQVKVVGATTLLHQGITLNGAGNGDIRWTNRTYSFVADSALTTLSFLDKSSYTIGIDILLDHVRVDGPPVFPDSAPVAVADAYAVNQDTKLVVPPAAGVLANDAGPQSAAPTAVLVSGPSSGSLALNANGGFTYAPAAGFTGGDSFTYRASNGSLVSNTVTVALTVMEVVPGLLENPSFEADFTAWSATGNLEINFYPPSHGIKSVQFNSMNRQPDAVVTQTFATQPGNSYRLTFDLAALAYTRDTQRLGVTVTGAGELLSRTVTVQGQAAGLGSWLTQEFAFVADSPATTLTFRDLSTATLGIDLLLDNVRVSGGGPEPIATPQEEPLPTPSLAVQPAGGSVIRMTAPRSGLYVLERSDDLRRWQVIDSTDCLAGESFEFHDAPDPENPSATPPRMFYRIGWQEN